MARTIVITIAPDAMDRQLFLVELGEVLGKLGKSMSLIDLDQRDPGPYSRFEVALEVAYGRNRRSVQVWDYSWVDARFDEFVRSGRELDAEGYHRFLTRLQRAIELGKVRLLFVVLHDVRMTIDATTASQKALGYSDFFVQANRSAQIRQQADRVTNFLNELARLPSAWPTAKALSIAEGEGHREFADRVAELARIEKW
jgi:hypothetical protein